MFSVNTPLIPKTKDLVSTHPRTKQIKNCYANKIRRAHNSVRTVLHQPEEDMRSQNRITFTVIGNRVTKEFIYCVNMVQGMHRHRWKHYNIPVIKGCSEVEWPKILQDLSIHFENVRRCIQSSVVVFCDGKCIGGEQELKDLIESKYVYHLALDYQKESLKHFANYVKSSERPCAYMHISIDEKPIGSMIFMLYSDVVLATCENFLRLCKARKGGYSGTPVHRVVKDGWIQCGGFGLKNSPEMDCENFIVPNDKRGVLGMANAGRHVDCSTQFYVLSQPNDWLNGKFVAFGQLIDGEETLKKIEEVDTYYEAPAAHITIYSAGILNLDCQDIKINKSALEYLDGHIEDLVSLGDMLYELLMEKVWLEIEFSLIQKLMPAEIEGEDNYEAAFEKTVDVGNNLKPKITSSIVGSASVKSGSKGQYKENEDFDVEEYEYKYEQETYSYSHITPFVETKAKKPYYLAFTDKPYPGEVDSNFDLKRLLQGDYCLEADLDPKQRKNKIDKLISEHKLKTLSALITAKEESEDSASSNSFSDTIDSEEERELSRYLSMYADKACFSGEKIKYISQQNFKINPLERKTPYCKEVITDEGIRLMRMALKDYKSYKQVSFIDNVHSTHKKILRRPTPYVRQSFTNDEETEEEEAIPEKHQKKVSIKPEPANLSQRRIQRKIMESLEEEANLKSRRSTKHISLDVRKASSSTRYFYRMSMDNDDEGRKSRPSALTRLFDDVDIREQTPQLKYFRPRESISGRKRTKLAISDSDEFNPTWLRRSISRPTLHKSDGKDTIEQARRDSRKTRNKSIPFITVSEYRKMNDERLEQIKKLVTETTKTGRQYASVRLPGDTPIYSPTISSSIMLPNIRKNNE